MKTNILNKVNGSRYQLFLYGGVSFILLEFSNKLKNIFTLTLLKHDTYVAALTKLLNLTTHINQPPYVSAIIVELRQSISNPNDYYIQVYLKNNTMYEEIKLRPMTVYGEYNIIIISNIIIILLC